MVAGAVALGLAMVAAGTAVRADVEESQVDRLALELDGVSTGRPAVPVGASRVCSSLSSGCRSGWPVVWRLTVLGVRLLLTGPGGEVVVPPLRPVLDGLPVSLVALTAAAGVVAASLATAATACRESWTPLTDLDLP